MLPIQTVLHPTDFSESSESAFRLACSLARDYGARLVIMHVAELPASVVGEGALLIPPTLDLESIRQRLEKVRPDDPKILVQHEVVEGNPAREILGAVASTKCDLIVMGTHGRTGLRRLLMGSVAEQVVRRASCPVLTVTTPASKTSTRISETAEGQGVAAKA